MTQNLINCHVNDALDHINQAEYGDHFMIVYPDLATLRKLYSSYTHKQLEENNEIVVINPFYETIDSAKQVLCRYDNGIDNISKYENENALVIADSLEEYLGDNPLIYVKKGLANCTKKGKNGLSVLADMGAYSHRSKYKELVDYELSLPAKYDVPMKGFCLYHQRDFDRLSEEHRQKLVEHHGKAMKVIETPT